MLTLLKNNGQTAALDAGFKIATGDLIVTMDADLQTNPEDIYTLLPYIEKILYGKWNEKKSREDGLKRKISSLVGNGVRNFVTRDNIKDTGCPLRLFKKRL